MSADIQQARDILAKWRKGMTLGAWRVEEPNADGDWLIAADDGDMAVATVHGWSHDAKAIVGTAGNPALLDALDGLLACGAEWDEYEPDHVMAGQARHLAAAIIAADERMTS